MRVKTSSMARGTTPGLFWLPCVGVVCRGGGGEYLEVVASVWCRAYQHGVGLAAAGDTIGKDSAVDALHDSLHHWLGNVVVHQLVVGGAIVDIVKGVAHFGNIFVTDEGDPISSRCFPRLVVVAFTFTIAVG